jgi:iron complex transport system substrate-binding protein
MFKMFKKRFVHVFLALVLLLSVSSTVMAAETRIVLDSNGKEVALPAEVTKAAPAIGAFAQMTEVLTSGGGKISAAAVFNLTDYFKKVFPDYAKSNAKNYNATIVEDVIASGAQVAYGPSSIFTEEQRAQLKAAGIPYVEINNIATVDGMCESFGIIGNILGKAEAAKAAEFVAYYRGNMRKAQDLSAGITGADRAGLLILRLAGETFSTINGRDICNEYIEAAGGINVAKDYAGKASGTALTVDSEQIVQWNPKVIVVGDKLCYNAVMADPALAETDAVKNGNVPICPYGIYILKSRNFYT